MNITKTSKLYRYANAAPFARNVEDGCSLIAGVVMSTLYFAAMGIVLLACPTIVGAMFQIAIGNGNAPFSFSASIMVIAQGAAILTAIAGVSFAVAYLGPKLCRFLSRQIKITEG